MEFIDVQKKSVSGSVPDFGAIFMSNSTTREECFEKKLFGLPPSFANFVRKVKAGIILFLFEYEQRKLYGVFQATSDGAMNIIPHAFSSSGKQFSAQVQFSTIWKCHPLSECDFRDAIRDNYFAAYKFNFGLSKDQVYRLLWLFNSRKVRIQNPQRFLTKSNVKKRHLKSSVKVNPVVYSDKVVSEKDHPMVESYHRLSSEVPHSTTVQISNSRCSTSHGDPIAESKQPESTACDYPYNPEAPGFQYPTVSGTSNSFTSVYRFASHSMGASQSLSLLSKSQSVPFHVEPENLNVSSYSVTTDLGDYIPLSSPEHSDSTSLEDYEDLNSFEACIVPTPLLSGGIFGRGNLEHPSSAFSPDRGPCYGNYESSVVTVPLSDVDDWHLKEGAYPLRSRSIDSQEHSEPVLDDYQSFDGLYSDIPITRTSVFSRLTLASKASVQENEDSTEVDQSVHGIMEKLLQRHNWKEMKKAKSTARENEDNTLNKRISVFSRLNLASKAIVPEKEDNTKVDKSVNKIMEKLQQNHDHWKKTMREPKLFIRNYDYGENFNMSTQLEMIEDASRASKEYPEDTWNSKRVAEHNPLCNFKRRNELLKTGSETEGRGCIDGVEGECSSENQRKRRLVRPMFRSKSSDVKSIICDGWPNVQMPSQESSAGEENSGSCEASIKSDRINDDENGFSRKDPVSSVMCQIGCEGNSGGTGKGLTDMHSKLGDLVGGRNCCLNDATSRADEGSSDDESRVEILPRAFQSEGA